MPVVVAVGAAIGTEVIGGAIAGVVGSAVASAVGGAIGGALAGGVSSLAQGGDFEDGFKAGALGGVVQGAASGFMSGIGSAAEGAAAEGVTSSAVPTALSPVGSVDELSKLATTANTAGSLEVPNLGSGLQDLTSKAVQAPSVVTTPAATDLTSLFQQPTATTPSVVSVPLEQSIQAAQAAQAGVAPSLSTLGNTGSAVSGNQYGGLSDILKNTLGKQTGSQLGGSVYDTAIRGQAVAKANDAMVNLQNSYNTNYSGLSSLGTGMINERQSRANETNQRIQNLLAKWGAK